MIVLLIIRCLGWSIERLRSDFQLIVDWVGELIDW